MNTRHQLTRFLSVCGCALLAAAFAAVSRWSLTFSRLGFRGILIPLTGCIMIYILTEIMPEKPLRGSIAAGGVLGLGMYTGIPFRVFPAVVFLALFLGTIHNVARFVCR